MHMKTIITKEYLDGLYERFDCKKFAEGDPCGVVRELTTHTTLQLDIELGALFVAMISWGSRRAFIPIALRMMRDEMEWHPARYIMERRYMNAFPQAKNGCVYRTLNVTMYKAICENLFSVLQTGPETLERYFTGRPTIEVISEICQWMAPAKMGSVGRSACKRVCMYVRWMTRRAIPDFGLWSSRDESDLYAVMDVHVCRLTASLLGLSTKHTPTWRTTAALTDIFRSWCPSDPLKYDVALMVAADNKD